MIRNMVGALILIGKGNKEPEIIKEMLDKEEKIYNYKTAPASGMYLVDVKY